MKRLVQPRVLLPALALACGLVASTCYVFQKPDAIIFSHKRHLSESAACVDCHGDMTQVVDMVQSRLPPMAKCLECHEDREKACAYCHVTPSAPEPAARNVLGGILFNHKNHAQRTKNDCATCHKRVMEAEEPRYSTRPEMLDECMQCHKSDFRNIECTKCHTNLTELRQKPFDLFSHRGNFLEKHPIVAKGDLVVCSHCHKDNFCTDCHSRMAPMKPSLMRSDEPDRQLIHRGDFLTTHPMDARLDGKQCLTCHRQNFCQDCHTKNGLSARGLTNGLGPHPSGWLVKGSGDFHGPPARRDIGSCATCHERGAESNCIGCHKVGGVGGNPHPPGWESRIDPQRGHACVMCHR